MDDTARKTRNQERFVDLDIVDNLYLQAKQPKYIIRTKNTIRAILKKMALQSGRMLEVSPGANCLQKYFPAFAYSVLLYGDGDQSRYNDCEVFHGDIVDCKHIPDNSFDVVISIQVFEHLKRPWLAASEIMRILKPGGIMFASTVFSWRYHPNPVDYWRFTPDCLEFLFGDLKTLYKKFDISDRRKNMIKDCAEIPNDILGGWRENIRVNYAGQKAGTHEE